MYKPGVTDSMRGGNGYTFHCPVVDRDALYVVCGFKRHKHWRGEDFQDHDCKCAMNGNKCPALHMLKMEWGADKSLFFDTETKRHQLPQEVLERIERVRLLPTQAAGLNLTAEQRELLFGNEHAHKSVPESVTVATKEHKVRRANAKSTKPKTIDLTAGLEEIRSMSDQINQSLKEKSNG